MRARIFPARRTHTPAALLLRRALAAAVGLALGAGAAGQTASAPAPAGPTVVYQSQYDDPHNLALWSVPQTDHSAGRTFLGRFYNVSESLALKALPAHAFVRLRAQLCIMDSWDGNNPGDGPDQLAIRLGDGRTLMQSTFVIYGKNDVRTPNPPKQSFPDNYGTGDYTGLTGVDTAEVKWLPKSNQTWGGNAVYSVEFIFPHTAADLRIDFRSSLVDSQPTIENESWGLGNVQVALLPEAPVRLNADQVRQLVAELGRDDPVAANQALCTLISAGDGALEAIGQCLASKTPATPERLAQLIRQLDDDKYALREAAQKELEAGGREALLACSQALRAGPPPEAESRLTLIVGTLSKSTIKLADQRLWRVLEIIGSEQARALQARLFAGGTLPDLTTLRERLQAACGQVFTDEQWKLLGPKVDRVLKALNDPRATAARETFLAQANVSPALRDLRRLLAAPAPDDAQLKSVLQSAHDPHGFGDAALDPALEQEINAARRELRRVVTLRQEAALVALNILD